MDSATSDRSFDGSTVAELIDAFGGAAAFARIVRKGSSTASEMKRRGSIPVEYWPAIVTAAAEDGLAGVSYDRLVALHAPQVGVSERVEAEVPA